MASTTSFTVVPCSFFSRLTSARLAAAKATRRRPVMATLTEVRGAVSGRPPLPVAHLADPAHAEDRLAGAPEGAGDLEGLEQPGHHGLAETSSKSDGMRPTSWSWGISGWTAESGSRSNKMPSSSAPETPSTVLWCILATRAILPPSSPSTNHISHSGRSRWSWRLSTSAANSASSRIPPGEGRAARRRWLSMSKCGSSTQIG